MEDTVWRWRQKFIPKSWHDRDKESTYVPTASNPTYIYILTYNRREMGKALPTFLVRDWDRDRGLGIVLDGGDVFEKAFSDSVPPYYHP